MNNFENPQFAHNPSNLSIPIVVEEGPGGIQRSYDLSSRMMQDRIIMLDSDFNSAMAHVIKMQLLWLDSQSAAPINLYISSPGGSVHDGLGIADVVANLRAPVKTIVMGMAASMGCYMQSTMGSEGLRLAGRRAQIMAHQVSSGTKGVIMDQRVSLNHSESLNELLMKEIAEAVGVSYDQFLHDCNRDMWLNAYDAMHYGTKGFLDGVFVGKQNEKGQYLVLRRNGNEEWV